MRTWDRGEEDVDGDDRGLKATLRVRVEGALTATSRAQRLYIYTYIYVLQSAHMYAYMHACICMHIHMRALLNLYTHLLPSFGAQLDQRLVALRVPSPVLPQHLLRQRRPDSRPAGRELRGVVEAHLLVVDP